MSLSKSKNIGTLPLSGKHLYIVLVSSMEQLIGAAQSTIVGIVIPLLNLFLHPQLAASVQGVMGAVGLIGIAIGSALVGPLADKYGYLGWFRVCPVLIVIGSLVASILPDPWLISVGMFIAGVGVGGGYPLDSAYISELMPAKWRNFMVGVAKAVCAVGFVLPAAIAVAVLRDVPSPAVWRWIVWIMGMLGLITLLLRIRWVQSPGWLLSRGRVREADNAAKFFFGKDAEIGAPSANDGNTPEQAEQKESMSLFKGVNLLRVIYSGIPWACEGLGIYGIGVFLPVLLMALGIDQNHGGGIPEVIDSVGLTALINLCILPGFVLGLMLVNRLNHSFMMWTGFLGSAISLSLLFASYKLGWPIWLIIGAFMVFEVFLNAGPHLITYVIPAAIFPVRIKGAGAGIAGFLGKVGAILGVFFMPILLRAGGMTLVLIVSVAVMLLGAAITLVCSHLLGLKPFCPHEQND